MAKKNGSRKAKVTQPRVKVTPAAEPVKAPAQGSMKIIVGAVLILLAVITVIEISSVVKLNIFASKKPVMLAQWKVGSESTGLTSMYVYGGTVYNVDGTRGTMMAYDEMTGNFLGKYALPQGIISMARLSNGDVLALTSANTVVRFTSIKAKPSAGIPVEGCSAARYIAADSKDNVYIADSGRNIIIKCDKALKKTAEYGKDKLTGLKRVFIGPQDSIYAMDSLSPGKLTVKIFSADGVMKKQFNVLNNALLSGLEGLAVTPGGEVYMNSTGANSVLCYGPDGNLLGAIRSAAGNDTPFSYPPGIAGGMDGKFIVATYSMLVLQDIKY